MDLSSHHVIDLLAERSTKTAAEWMHSHPELEYVSRDRGTDYAQAIREGAPQAIPVADRFHLTKNLVEAIEPLVARCYKELRRAQAPLPPPAVPNATEWRQALATRAEQQRLTRLANKQVQLQQIIDLQVRGVQQKEIASRLGISVRTVRRWIKRESCPGSARSRRRRSIFDPYAPYVLSRWQQGCRDISLLWEEIRAQGFFGKIRTVYRFIRTLRQELVVLPAPSMLDHVSVQEAVWLIARPRECLKADERADLQELCQASPQLARLHGLVQLFGQMVRTREGHRLAEWKKQVAESGLCDVQRFAKGLERDNEAVLAGLTVVHSNGQVEGQVNKLKLLKRTMYSRASFPLLRQRVLHAL